MRRFVRKGLFATAILVITFFAGHHLLSFKPGLLEDSAAFISYPCICLSRSVTAPIKHFFDRKQSYNELMEKHQQLTLDYEKLLSQSIELRSKLHFAANIKELVEFAERYELGDTLLANVLVRNLSSSEHYFFVNRGRRDGVKKDMIALYNTHIIGRISQVYYWYSKVRLITDQHSKIAGYSSNTNASGIVQGQNNCNSLKFTYVSHLLDIEDNDLVISSGQGLVFPEGFCLGKITHHEKKEKALYHTIHLKPQIDLEKISSCLLLDQSKVTLF